MSVNPNLPVRYGASYASNATLGGGASSAIVLPAANVNGITVHAASFSVYCGGFADAAILAKSSAPANVADGVPLVKSQFFSWNGAQGFCGGVMGRDIFIPAGLGIYAFSFTAESGAARSLIYTVH